MAFEIKSCLRLQKSVAVLQEQGYSVRVIKPNQLGDDFNDVLKKQGPQGVRQVIEKGLRRENFLRKEQVEKVFAKDFSVGSAPARTPFPSVSLSNQKSYAKEMELDDMEMGR